MKGKLIVASAVIIAIIVGLMVSFMPRSSDQSEPTKTTEVSTSTSETKQSKSNPTIVTDRENVFSTTEPVKNDNKLTTAPHAHYEPFTSVDQFKKTSGTRVLFFYADSSKACQDLDADITDNLMKFKTDTTIFKIDFASHQDIAKAYGVLKESTILKFDDHGQVNGIFFAEDYPTAAALKTNLQI